MFANLQRSFDRRVSCGVAHLRISTAVESKEEGAVKSIFGYQLHFFYKFLFLSSERMNELIIMAILV
jgi:hypothetical protein